MAHRSLELILVWLRKATKVSVQQVLPDVIFLAGGAGIVIGVGKIYVPAAYVVGGAFLCFIAYIMGGKR